MAIVCVGVDLAKNVRSGPRTAGCYDARPDPFHLGSLRTSDDDSPWGL